MTAPVEDRLNWGRTEVLFRLQTGVDPSESDDAWVEAVTKVAVDVCFAAYHGDEAARAAHDWLMLAALSHLIKYPEFDMEAP